MMQAYNGTVNENYVYIYINRNVIIILIYKYFYIFLCGVQLENVSNTRVCRDYNFQQDKEGNMKQPAFLRVSSDRSDDFFKFPCTFCPS